MINLSNQVILITDASRGIDTMPEEVWDETMDANLKSIFQTHARRK